MTDIRSPVFVERAFDYSKNKAALTLLSDYPTPDGLRRIGTSRLTAWLKKRRCRNSAAVAQKAVDAANSQRPCTWTAPGRSSQIRRFQQLDNAASTTGRSYLRGYLRSLWRDDVS